MSSTGNFSITSVVRSGESYDGFAAIFWDLPAPNEIRKHTERIAKLTTHPFYVRIQRNWLRRKAGQADEYRLVAAQSRFAQRLMARPTLGLELAAEEDRLAAFVSNHARNIATLVCRANHPLGHTSEDLGFLATGDDMLDDIQWRDFVNALYERCYATLDDDEHLVACFRWFLRWSVQTTATVLGLSVAQVKYREVSARRKVGPWIAEYCGIIDRRERNTSAG